MVDNIENLHLIPPEKFTRHVGIMHYISPTKYECFCPKCNIYKAVENGKVIKRSGGNPLVLHTFLTDPSKLSIEITKARIKVSIIARIIPK